MEHHCTKWDENIEAIEYGEEEARNNASGITIESYKYCPYCGAELCPHLWVVNGTRKRCIQCELDLDIIVPFDGPCFG